MTAPRLDILNINFYDWAGERLYRGGAERYVLDLAGLARSIGLVPRILQNAWQPFATTVDGIEVVGVPAATQVDFHALSAGFAPQVEGAALVIASPLELACALPGSTPVIGISHGIWWDDPSGQLADPDRERSRLREALARVATCVCVDTNFINWVRTQGDPAQPKLEYLPNCVALDRFPAQAKSFDGPLRVLFPRRLCAERGFPGVLEAFDYLLPRHPDLELHLCGGGAEREEVLAREFVARHRDRARWSDLPMDEMPSAYAASHVVLVPTEYGEGTSLACIEGMATNNAVVATHVGGLPNLVLDGYNGLLIKPGPQALVDAVERLVADRVLTARLAAHALEVAVTFGRARWQTRWLDLMGRALGRAPMAAELRGTAAVPDARAPATAAADPAHDAKRLALSLADAMASRDSLADAMRLVVQERDAARRHRERTMAERDAARAESDLARRERSLAVAQAELDRRELATAKDAVAAVSAERDALAIKAQDRERMATEASTREADLRRVVGGLEHALSARDEGIVWLRDELKLAYDRFARRRASVKLTGIDFAYALANRFPRAKRFAKALVPSAIRRRFNRASAEQQGLASPPAAAATAGAAPAIATYAAPTTNALAPAGSALAPAGAAGTPAAAAPSGYDVICFANIEWSARYQRPQHMMSRFADDGHRVFYVIASRAPPPGEPYAIEPVAHNVFQVCLAVDAMQDFYGKAMSDGNEAAMAEAVAALARDRRIKAAITVVHLPYWARLAERLRERRDWRIVYDCMDEWADFPAIGRELLVEEERLVRTADLVTVTAALLEQKWSGVARRCVLARNGVDFDFFARNCVPNGILEGVRRPIVGYYGALADWVDLELIAAVARRRPDWNFVLLGDVFVKDLCGLDALPNVQLLGRRPYQEMPKYLYHFDVCLVPFKLNDVTHAVDPVKFYEYISAGKPVVAVPLKEMAIYGDYAYFATGPDEFVAGIESALAENDPALWNRRVALARDNDWAERYRVTRDAVEAAHPLVSIIVVSYFNAEMTRLCVESIFRTQTWPRIELIVVDNASTDETRTYLKFLNRVRPDVTIILNDENRGFAAANNQGLAVARGEFIVLLNNDTVVPRGWLEPLLAHLRDPGIGMVGPVTNFVGNEAKVAVDYESLDRMEDFAERYTGAHAGRTFDIAVLAMFCVMFTRATFERIGLLDEGFGMGMFEDDDYSKRMHSAGLRTVCAEDAFVHHFGQAAFKKLIASGEYHRLWETNQAYFEAKWGEWKPHEHRQ